MSDLIESIRKQFDAKITHDYDVSYRLTEDKMKELVDDFDKLTRLHYAARESLKKYGEHEFDCDAVNGCPPCDCGFHAALKECEG